MEDLNKSIKETSVIDSDIKGKDKEVIKNIKTKVRKNWSSIILVISLVLVILSYCIFMFVYFDKTYSPSGIIPNNIIQPDQDSTTAESPTEEDSSETEEKVSEAEDDWNETLVGKVSDKSDGMKEYNNDIIGIRFILPNTWIIKERYCDEFNSDICHVYFLENEEKGSYFEYAYINGTGYLPCYYSDTPKEYFEEDEMYDSSNMYGGDYTSVDKNDEFRRSYISEEDPHRNFYRICRKGDSPSYYTNWIQPGFVLYWVKKDRDDLENILEIFDNILLSFEYFGEKTY